MFRWILVKQVIVIYNSYQEQVLRNHSSVIENNFTVLNCLITVLEVNYIGEKKCGLFGRRVFKTEGKVYANALRWEWAWHVWECARRVVWLELSKDRSDQRSGQWQDYAGPLASKCSEVLPSNWGMRMIHPTPWLLVSLISFPKAFHVSFSHLLPLLHPGPCLHLNSSISEITISDIPSSETDPAHWSVTSNTPVLQLQRDLQFSYPNPLHLTASACWYFPPSPAWFTTHHFKQPITANILNPFFCTFHCTYLARHIWMQMSIFLPASSWPLRPTEEICWSTQAIPVLH